MRPPLGFILVTHGESSQTLQLCRRLTAMFDEPPIAIHHDFSKCDLDRTEFPSNVRFVENWVKTGWGTIGVVDALLSAVRLMYGAQDGWGDPEWIASLSAADYPVQTAETILSDLASSSFDGYLDSRRVQYYPGPFLDKKLGEFPFQQPRFHSFAFNRYMAIPLLSIPLARRLHVPVEKYTIRSRWMIQRFTPFHGDVACYAGDAWMTVRRHVARIFIEETPLWNSVHRHLDGRLVPEESFYHTMLGNTPGLNMSVDNLRYTDWKGCYAHPRTLGREDFPRLLATHCHFARKFPNDPALFKELDAAVATKTLQPAAGRI